MNRGSTETSKHVQTWQDSKGQPRDALGFFGAILQTCPRRIYDITTYTFNNYIYKHAINMPKGAMNNWKSKAWHLYIYIHMHVLHDTPNNIYIHYLMINMTRSHRPAARWREGGVKTKEGDGNERCCQITWTTNMKIISTHHKNNNKHICNSTSTHHIGKTISNTHMWTPNHNLPQQTYLNNKYWQWSLIVSLVKQSAPSSLMRTQNAPRPHASKPSAPYPQSLRPHATKPSAQYLAWKMYTPQMHSTNTNEH